MPVFNMELSTEKTCNSGAIFFSLSALLVGFPQASGRQDDGLNRPLIRSGRALLMSFPRIVSWLLCELWNSLTPRLLQYWRISISLFFLIGCSTDGKQAEEQSAAASEEENYPFCREPSYFEIPTKEFHQHSQIPEGTIHEIPTKDTHIAGAGHASFTIEFDDSTPGKVTIKDHVTKFTPDQRHKSKKPSPSGAQDLPGLQTVMMAPESKVANWLAQNNPPTMIWESTEEDSKSIKSDVPVYLKRLKGKTNNFSCIYFLCLEYSAVSMLTGTVHIYYTLLEFLQTRMF